MLVYPPQVLERANEVDGNEDESYSTEEISYVALVTSKRLRA